MYATIFSPKKVQKVRISQKNGMLHKILVFYVQNTCVEKAFRGVVNATAEWGKVLVFVILSRKSGWFFYFKNPHIEIVEICENS